MIIIIAYLQLGTNNNKQLTYFLLIQAHTSLLHDEIQSDDQKIIAVL